MELMAILFLEIWLLHLGGFVAPANIPEFPQHQQIWVFRELRQLVQLCGLLAGLALTDHNVHEEAILGLIDSSLEVPYLLF